MTIQCLGQHHGERYASYWGDTVQIAFQLPDECIDFSICSPPFSNLFCYSDSVADMGNCRDDDEFLEQYEMLCREVYRATVPGRCWAVHCSDVPLQKWKDNVIGIKHLTGKIINAHEAAGWVTHSIVTVWKDPVVEMTRTKALGLLHMQLLKDSCRSRAGMPDYLIVFRKPGDNPRPVTHDERDFPVSLWQKWASPVWMDINQTDTLNVAVAREDKDERHLCALQKDLIERAIVLYSNPGDVVASWFGGIGSEGYVALQLKRKALLVELKEAYWKQGIKNMDPVDRQRDIFESLGA